jgi:hypothetical protein
MSKPTFRIPGPIGLDQHRVDLQEPVGRHVGVGGGMTGGGFVLGPAWTSGAGARSYHGMPAFPHIDFGQLYLSALARKQDPALINQSISSLCGPAALLFVVAKHWPALYFQFAVELYEYGTARINRLRITPGKGCRNFDPSNKINAADWVTLAGIRDSENTLLEYSSASDEAAGITLPSTLAGWLERAGFKSIRNETNLYLTKGENNLREAAKLRSEGSEVCLFINASGIEDSPSDRGFFSQLATTANHWVVLTSDIALGQDGTVSFTVFSWGEGARPVPYQGGDKNTTASQKMTLKQWLQNYYGYVACKP